MSDWGVTAWTGIVGVVIAGLGLWIGWQTYRRGKAKPPETATRVNVSGSPGAKVAGRDVGGAGGDGAHKASVTVKDSKDANVAGRDAGQD